MRSYHICFPMFRGCDLLLCHYSTLFRHLHRPSGSDSLTSDGFSVHVFMGFVFMSGVSGMRSYHICVPMFRGCDLWICHYSTLFLHLDRQSGSHFLILFPDWLSFPMFRGCDPWIGHHSNHFPHLDRPSDWFFLPMFWGCELLICHYSTLFLHLDRPSGSDPLTLLSDGFSVHVFLAAIF
jgi:hypothetical protein